MRKQCAIGYLSREVSGEAREQDETDIHRAAQLLEYDLTLIVYGSDAAADLERLEALFHSEAADAIITPSSGHLCEDDIDALFPFADIYTLADMKRYTTHGEDDPEPEGTLRIVDFVFGPTALPPTLEDITESADGAGVDIS